MSGKSLSLVQYRNCSLLKDHKLIRDDFWVRNGKILNPEKVFFDERRAADVQIDCGGAIIAPGFIDLQCNGAFGVDFSDVKTDIGGRLGTVTSGLLQHGVTSFCPTVITLPSEHYRKILPVFKRRDGGDHGTGVLGLHLEGPFISEAKKGAHPQEFLRSPGNGTADLLEMYGTLDEVAIVTLAPELPGAMDTIEELTKRGIVVSLGHSTADLATGEKAVKSGASFITHLFNAMLPFHHRDPHLVGLLASDQITPDRPIYYGMISDGIHTHGSALRIAYRTHPKGLVLVTDAVPAMGLSVGVHHVGTQKVEIHPDGRALIAGTNTLCGSIATMNECVQHFKKATGCTLVEALETATLHPAQVLGVTQQKGTLEYDTDADFILLDQDLSVLATFIGGDKVWQRKGVELPSKQNRDGKATLIVQ